MIELGVCGFENIKELRINIEKTKATVQGTSYCKIYDIPKDINLHVANNKLVASFDLDVLKTKLVKQNYVRNMKFIKIINECIEHAKIKDLEHSWKSLLNSSTELEGSIVHSLNTMEKKIKYKTHIVYLQNSLDNFVCLNDDFFIVNKENTEQKLHIEKKSNLELAIKSLGGIIFDYDNNFIHKFNDSLKEEKNSISKNILISDILPKNKSNLNFTYFHVKNIKCDNSLEHTRLVIYYPTKSMLTQITKLITNGLVQPRIVWLVFPYIQVNSSDSSSYLNFNEVLNILFWSKKLIKTFNPTIISLKCGEKKLEKKNNQIKLEKVKYKLNKFEEKLLSDVNNENLSILDKLYFYNINEPLPETIYECRECPICCLDFEENQDCVAYMPCGHIFCSECVMKTIKVKKCCPTCRKMSKFTGIIIPKLTSSKMEILTRILDVINCKNNSTKNNGISIIYVDTFTISKKLMMYLNKIDNNCNIINQKSPDSKRENETILICPTENDFLCQNIKNIKNVIVLTSSSDFSLKPESLGYDYCYGSSDIKLWLLECKNFSK
jgi:hypothetical protein